ncbi:TonB-dependent receptor [Shewanella sp.]|nr:TonB-dependent receptor [Shewanella sp.]
MNGNSTIKRFTARKTLAALAVGSVLMMSTPAAIAADKVNGTIGGQVYVGSGEELQGVSVVITHDTKGLTRTVTTDSDGRFSIRSLPIGLYTLKFFKNGYETLEEKKLRINAGQRSTIDVEMLLAGVERISVTGSKIRRLDLENSSTSLVMTAQDLELLPIASNLASVALLAPGTSSGDSDFGNHASFNGASVAENGYFLNGINITNIRTGIGYVDLPWASISQISVISGGVSAEYGNFIGGVTDLVSKSGDNEFNFGVEVKYTPKDFLDGDSPDVWLSQENDPSSAYMDVNNQDDTYEETEASFWASGAIIEDHLFFYGVYNPKSQNENRATSGSMIRRDTTGDFWLGKLDWYINDDHRLGITGFGNEFEWDDASAAYNAQTNRVIDASGQVSPAIAAGLYKNASNGLWSPSAGNKSGGELFSVNYSGTFTDWLSVSAVYGKLTQTQETINPTAGINYTYDITGPSQINVFNYAAINDIDKQKDTRTNFRIDFDMEFGDHNVKLGYANEKIETFDHIVGAGSGWRAEIRQVTSDTDWTGLANGSFYTANRKFAVHGSTASTLESLYIQDTWSITDNLVVNLGLRHSGFSNENKQGNEYVSMENQLAPRVGVSYDFMGDGSSKLSLNYGRYFMPVSPNTNVRMTLGETNKYEYFEIDGIDQNGVPIRADNGNAPLLWSKTYQDGVPAQPWETMADAKLSPMYSDEYAIAYQHELNDDWAAGLRMTYINLESSIEDVSMMYALKNLQKNDPEAYKKLGIDTSNTDLWIASLINPGQPVHMRGDLNGDGVIGDNEYHTFSAEELGYPEAERKYRSIELTLDGNVNEDFKLNASYTYSRSEGNTEGLLKSDNDQADPGWTRSFDSPELTDNSYGRLPNDTPHNFKLRGTYRVTDELSVGFVSSIVSGRPINAFGYHPTDAGSCATSVSQCWDNEDPNFYVNGQPSERGSAGRTPTIYNFDLNVLYTQQVGPGDLTLQASLFNVFNFKSVTQVEEQYEINKTIGSENPNYGTGTNYQSPRYVTLTARYEF